MRFLQQLCIHTSYITLTLYMGTLQLCIGTNCSSSGWSDVTLDNIYTPSTHHLHTIYTLTTQCSSVYLHENTATLCVFVPTAAPEGRWSDVTQEATKVMAILNNVERTYIQQYTTYKMRI